MILERLEKQETFLENVMFMKRNAIQNSEFRQMMISDAMDDLADQKQASYEAIMEASGLRVHDNEIGPGFYVGDRGDPEMMEFAMNEDDAYSILDDMELEYFENNCK